MPSTITSASVCLQYEIILVNHIEWRIFLPSHSTSSYSLLFIFTVVDAHIIASDVKDDDVDQQVLSREQLQLEGGHYRNESQQYSQ